MSVMIANKHQIYLQQPCTAAASRTIISCQLGKLRRLSMTAPEKKKIFFKTTAVLGCYILWVDYHDRHVV